MWLSDAQDERLSKKLGQTLVFCNKYLTLPLKKKKKMWEFSGDKDIQYLVWTNFRVISCWSKHLSVEAFFKGITLFIF